MTIKPALCRADQSSSFGHLRPPPQTSVTTTPNCPPLHVPHHARAIHSTIQELCQTTPSCEALQRGAQPLSRGIADTKRVGALDKALDTWYNTGVGLKETQQTGA